MHTSTYHARSKYIRAVHFLVLATVYALLSVSTVYLDVCKIATLIGRKTHMIIFSDALATIYVHEDEP